MYVLQAYKSNHHTEETYDESVVYFVRETQIIANRNTKRSLIMIEIVDTLARISTRKGI